MINPIKIGNRFVGPGFPTYVVAELSANHNQRLDTALELVRQAKWAGADAIKLQTYTPDTLTIKCDNEHFKINGTPWDGRTLHELYSEAYTPWEWHAQLKQTAVESGLDFFSTPFDRTAVDFLEVLGVPAHKIASFEIVDTPLVRYVSSKGKPIILSTGMANLAEIEEAVSAARSAGCAELALLKCVSSYPAQPEEMNLRTIPHLAEAFHVPVGISDHTLGIATPIAAVAMGACIIEKHFTIARSDGGPDQAFSLEPGEFKGMVQGVREAEKALGQVSYSVGEMEAANRVFRRSLFVVKDISVGEKFTEENVRSIRPGVGLHPRHLGEILKHTAAKAIIEGTPLRWDLIQNREEPARVNGRSST